MPQTSKKSSNPSFTLVQRVLAMSAAVVIMVIASTILTLAASRVVKGSEEASTHLSSLHDAVTSVMRGAGDLVLSEGSKSARDLLSNATAKVDEYFPQSVKHAPELQKELDLWGTAKPVIQKLLQNKNIGPEDEASLIAYGSLQEQMQAINNAVSEAEAGFAMRAVELTDRSFNIILACLLAISVVSAFSGVSVVRAIQKRVGGDPRNVVSAVRSIVAGDLTMHEPNADVANGSILAEMQIMRGTLSSMVGEIRQQSDELAGVAEQIGASSGSLHDRTVEAANQLAQSAQATQDLTKKATQTADMAHQASSMAAAASDLAGKGGQTVGQVVETMQQINQSSQKISEIISVIDGIAFQTNILALNAAVEAARAGEQGRGFAVVASEVRALAGRSAEAAREIKSLIGSSVDSVEAGRLQVERAGAAMNDIVSGVAEVTNLIGQISDAASGQRDALSLLSKTIATVDELTQKNVHVVDDSAAATIRLKEQAHTLVLSVSRFRT